MNKKLTVGNPFLKGGAKFQAYLVSYVNGKTPRFCNSERSFENLWRFRAFFCKY